MNLRNKLVLITGGAKGIGLATAQRILNEGGKVILWDFKEDDLNKSVNNFKEQGFDVFSQVCDVTNKEQVYNNANIIKEKFGGIDILINNAGVIRDRSFMKMSQQEWDTVININLNSLYTTTKAVLPYMKESGYGRIISASSINGYQGAFGQVNYAATKAGVSGFTRALCKEVGRYGITVNAVAPGFIKSEMSDSMPDEVVKASIAMIPVGRIGSAEDMGYTYLFLASKEAGFISGTTLHANGGSMPT